jgi:MoxR-like ATPase
MTDLAALERMIEEMEPVEPMTRWHKTAANTPTVHLEAKSIAEILRLARIGLETTRISEGHSPAREATLAIIAAVDRKVR